LTKKIIVLNANMDNNYMLFDEAVKLEINNNYKPDEINYYELRKMNIGFCTSCFKCMKHEQPVCYGVQDDFQELIS
jgi:multimeric flavodoxin WrbA